MTEAEQFCFVEDTMFITGRGLVIFTERWLTGHLSPGDWLELRSGTGERRLAQVRSIEMVRFATAERRVDAHNGGGLLLKGVDKGDVKPGDEVWSVPAPPSAAAAPPRKHWWQRLFGGKGGEPPL